MSSFLMTIIPMEERWFLEEEKKHNLLETNQ